MKTTTLRDDALIIIMDSSFTSFTSFTTSRSLTRPRTGPPSAAAATSARKIATSKKHHHQHHHRRNWTTSDFSAHVRHALECVEKNFFCDVENTTRAEKSAIIGKERVTTRTLVYVGNDAEKHVERVRITAVSGGGLANCLNIVATPRRLGKPSFGADVLNFGSGKSILVAFDFHPNTTSWDGDDTKNSKAKRIAREIKRKYGETLNATTPSEKFYEDTSGYFSEEMFFARPNTDKGGEETFELVLECFKEYLNGYVEVLKDGEDEEQGNEESAEAKEAFRRRLAKHDKWQMERDPAIKMFSSWYGEEWANDYANEILFPLAKECVS